MRFPNLLFRPICWSCRKGEEDEGDEEDEEEDEDENEEADWGDRKLWRIDTPIIFDWEWDRDEGKDPRTRRSYSQMETEMKDNCQWRQRWRTIFSGDRDEGQLSVETELKESFLTLEEKNVGDEMSIFLVYQLFCWADSKENVSFNLNSCRFL
jgi:hypothetical protein